MALIYCKFNEVKRLLLIFAFKKIAIKSFLIKKECGLFYGVPVQKNAEKLFFYILTYIFIVGKLLL